MRVPLRGMPLLAHIGARRRAGPRSCRPRLGSMSSGGSVRSMSTPSPRYGHPPPSRGFWPSRPPLRTVAGPSGGFVSMFSSGRGPGRQPRPGTRGDRRHAAHPAGRRVVGLWTQIDGILSSSELDEASRKSTQELRGQVEAAIAETERVVSFASAPAPYGGDTFRPHPYRLLTPPCAWLQIKAHEGAAPERPHAPPGHNGAAPPAEPQPGQQRQEGGNGARDTSSMAAGGEGQEAAAQQAPLSAFGRRVTAAGARTPAYCAAAACVCAQRETGTLWRWARTTRACTRTATTTPVSAAPPASRGALPADPLAFSQ